MDYSQSPSPFQPADPSPPETEAARQAAAEKPAAPPAALPRPNRETAHPILYPGLTWVLGLTVGVLLLRYIVPYFAEELQYAITRGEQRARYETAGEYLTQASLNDLSLAYQLVSQRVAPSVVHIRTVQIVDNRQADAEFTRLFGRPAPRESRGQGSGVVVDSDGYIITNYHVIHGSNEIEVQLSDGRTFEAEVVGVDAPTDLAVLKIAAPELTPAEWGDSSNLQVGSLVWAVGSPFGLERSITSGILSAKDRRGIARSNYQDFLQTDAAVNPGNSGGPLVDVEGRIVGINTAIIGNSFQGVSFSLSGDIARDVYQRLKASGHVARGWLGVALEEVTPQRAEELGLAQTSGVYVPQVIASESDPSPAQSAGVQAGDVILKWAGRDVDKPLTLSRLVAETKVGETADITVFRDRKEVVLRVIVGERPIRLN